MPAANRVAPADAETFFAEIDKALDGGCYPYRHPDINGRERRSAVRVAAQRLGIKPNSATTHLQACIATLGREPDWSKFSPRAEFLTPDLPSFQAPIEEIISKRLTEFSRRKTAKDARRIIRVPVRAEGPIGIVHLGDPHLDDPGTNLPLIIEHIDIINRTPGLFGSCVGDFINNWRGRLAHLHAAQSTTQQEALKLLEWFVKKARWLYLIGGNHDVWHGDGDPLIWLTRGGVYEWHGCRLALDFGRGRECRIHARHDFPGSSIYNPAHGATRAAKFAGEDHIYINGHKHEWAYVSQENPVKDLVWHAIQLGAYKQVDDYADTLGKIANRHGAACATIINPDARHAHDRVMVDWNIERAADFLKYLRKRAKV